VWFHAECSSEDWSGKAENSSGEGLHAYSFADSATFAGGLFSSALGRVLLASKPWRVVKAALERHGGLQARTKHTITNLEEFKSELGQVARQGFALDLEESTVGVCCIAAPVRNHNGDVIAAFSVSIKATRASGISDALRDAIIGQANSLSSNIGFDQEWMVENRRWSRRAKRQYFEVEPISGGRG
jgi:Bacterial transcriptional regulator